MSHEASIIAKSRSEEGNKKPEDLTLKYREEGVLLLQEHSLEKCGLE